MRTSFAIVVLLCSSQLATADEIGFQFSGSVFITSSEPAFGEPSHPFGENIPAFAPVNGRFIYDLDSTVSHEFDNCDCGGYRQQITGGFSVDFGTVHVRADDYVIEIANDFPQTNGPPADIISVKFADNLDPALTAPLNVAGREYSAGAMTLSFFGLSNALSTSALPTAFDLDQTPADFNALSEQSVGQQNVVFSITSISSFPVVPGDYDFNGIVNDADYDVWKSAYGSTSNLSADGNRNGIVDAADFTVWRDNKSSSLSVPEPASPIGGPAGYLCLALAVLAARARNPHANR